MPGISPAAGAWFCRLSGGAKMTNSTLRIVVMLGRTARFPAVLLPDQARGVRVRRAA
jgi:hypothetical protein